MKEWVGMEVSLAMDDRIINGLLGLLARRMNYALAISVEWER